MLTKTPPAEIPAPELLRAYRDHRAAKLARVIGGEGYTADELSAYVMQCREFDAAFFEAAKLPGMEYLAAWGLCARDEARAAHRQLMQG